MTPWQLLDEKVAELYNLSWSTEPDAPKKIAALESWLDGELVSPRHGTKGRMRVTQPGFLALFIHHFPSKDSDAGRLARGHAMYALPSWSPLQVASYAEVIHYTGEIYVIKHRHEAREAPFLIHESRENRRDLYPWKPYTP